MGYETELNKNKYFSVAVNWLCEHFEFEDIVETGTFMGTGSTTVFARTGIKTTTIECNKQRAEQATQNLSKYPNVTVINGLSVVTIIAPFPAGPRAVPLKKEILYIKNNIEGIMKYFH